MASVNIGGKIYNAESSPNIDGKYGPYYSLQQAWDFLYNNEFNVVGLTVGIIQTDSSIKEYWFKEAANSITDFVEKGVGITDFEELNHLPKYNGSVMNRSTNIPVVKTTVWDAKVNEAPSDGKQYARKNGAWAEVYDEDTKDFEQLTNKPKYKGNVMDRDTNIPEVKTADWDGAVTALGGHTVGANVPSNAKFTDTTPKYNGTTVTDMTNIPEVKTAVWDAKVPEAPNDGKKYARKNGTWVEDIDEDTKDFEQLTNKPKYKGNVMDRDTNIPEVKTADWDTAVNALNGHTVNANVPADAIFTDTKPKYNGTTVTNTTNIPEVKTAVWDAKVPEAPKDGKKYSRKNGTWVEDIDEDTKDFEELQNRPKYNGSTMNKNTDIPEVKSTEWDTAVQNLDGHTVGANVPADAKFTDTKPKYNGVVVTDTTNIPEVKTAVWDAKVPEAPSDGKQYARKNGAWAEVQGGSGETGDFDLLYNKPKYNGYVMSKNTDIPEVKTTAWDAKLDEAPSDNKQYARKNGAWVVVQGSGGTSDFEQLENRPKYNGTVMDKNTNIPEVKTTVWDGAVTNLGGHTVGANVPADAKFTDTVPKYNGVAVTDETDIPEVKTTVWDGAVTNLGGHTVGANVPADAVFTDTKPKYNGTVVTDATDIPEVKTTVWDGAVNALDGHTVGKDVPADAKFTDTKPKYNGVVVTDETDIPEVKTATWDAKLNDAPSDGKQYARKDGSWTEVQSGPSGTSDFEQLSNRPKYNSSIMTKDTDIPEVKTTAWDGAVTALGGHTIGANVPADAKFTDTKPKYNGTVVTDATDIPEVKTTVWDAKLNDAPSDGKRYDRKNGAWIEADSAAFKPMKATWESSSISTAQAADLIIQDPEVIKGNAYLGEVYWNDLSETFGILNAEVTAVVVLKEEVREGEYDGIVVFEMTSSNVPPYKWFYNSAAVQWRQETPVINDLNSDSTVEALSAAQGKLLNENKIGDAPSDNKKYVRKDAAWVEFVDEDTKDFELLTNRPKYNGTTMTKDTDIPEVKSSEWDGKSTVEANESGTSTSKAKYIKVNGHEKKIAVDGYDLDSISFDQNTNILTINGLQFKLTPFIPAVDVYICGGFMNTSSVNFGTKTVEELLAPTFKVEKTFAEASSYICTTAWGDGVVNSIYYVMVKDGIEPASAQMKSGGLESNFSKQDIYGDEWKAKHADVVINETTYHIFGYRTMFGADTTMQMWFELA